MAPAKPPATKWVEKPTGFLAAFDMLREGMQRAKSVVLPFTPVRSKFHVKLPPVVRSNRPRLRRRGGLSEVIVDRFVGKPLHRILSSTTTLYLPPRIRSLPRMLAWMWLCSTVKTCYSTHLITHTSQRPILRPQTFTHQSEP